MTQHVELEPKPKPRRELQVASLRELFKITTSLAIVNAARVLLGESEGATLHASLIFAAFLIVVVRYYYGNDLHLLEKYQGEAGRNRDNARLPIDFLFFFTEGLLLVGLSFQIRQVDYFSIILFVLFLVDCTWFGLVQLRERSDVPNGAEADVDRPAHQRWWFILNLIFFMVLGVVRFVVWPRFGEPGETDKPGDIKSDDIRVGVVFFIAVVHTIVDLGMNFRFYFDEYRRSTTFRFMVGGPFTGKLAGGAWQDSHLRACIKLAVQMLSMKGAEVYSAHLIEQFGTRLREARDYVPLDIKQAELCSHYVAFWDGTQSSGLAVELTIAASAGAQILLFNKRGTDSQPFLDELVRRSGGRVLDYDSEDDVSSGLLELNTSKVGRRKTAAAKTSAPHAAPVGVASSPPAGAPGRRTNRRRP